MKRFVTVFGAVAALFLSGAAQAADFTLGFDCPPKISGPAGEKKTVDVMCTLTTANNESPDGAQGWSIGMAITGGTITAFTVEGIEVSTIFQKDKVPAPPLDPYILDLADAGFVVFESFDVPVTCPGDLSGAVSAIVLHQTKKMVLQPNGTQNIAKITVEVTIPEAESTLNLAYMDGCVGSGQPVANVVTFAGASVTPVLGSCNIPLTAPQPEFRLAIEPEGKALTGSEDGYGVYEADVSPGPNAFACLVMLTSSNLPQGGDGPAGWSLGASTSQEIAPEDVIVCGVEVSTIFQKDKAPAPPLDPYILDLCDAGFAVNEPTVPESPKVGVVSAIVLHQTKKMVLHANATDPLLKFIFRLDVPEDATVEAQAQIEDGLVGSGQPVANVITYLGGSKSPTETKGIKIRLTGKKKEVPSMFTRGDPNEDNKVDIADPIWIVYEVVPSLGGPRSACMDLGDANDDGLVNLPDAIFLIQYLFLHGAPPAGMGLCLADPDSTIESCPPGSVKACPPQP